MILFLLACKPPVAPPEVNPAEFVLLHTNDLHGHYLPERAPWLPGEPEIGGMERLDAAIQAIRRTEGEERVVVFDAGDMLSGTPLTDMQVRGAQGGAMLEFIEAMGYDGWVLGNHEFDKGWQNAEAMVRASRIPVLSANLVDARTGGPAFEGLRSSMVVEVGRYEVGVIGLTTESLTAMTSKKVGERVQATDVAAAVRREMARLPGEVDMVVVVSHIGVEEDRALAEAVDGIDLIVGGHSHTMIREPEKVGDTWIVQAGCYTRSLGVLHLEPRADGTVELRGGTVDLTADSEASPDVADLVRRYDAQIRAEYDVTIGMALATLTRDYNQESPLGNWITDVLRAETGAEVAFYNAGGLRTDLVEGAITRRSIYEILPFGNEVVLFQLTGAEIQAVLLANAYAEQEEQRGYMQVSGATILWRERMGTVEVVEAKIGDERIDPTRLYSVASNSYVVEQAERYLSSAKPKNVSGLGISDYELVVSALEKGGPVDTPDLGRCRLYAP